MFSSTGRNAVASNNSSSGSISIISHLRVECVSCANSFQRSANTFQAPCEHHYCSDCLQRFVEASIGDESLFPLRCCQQSMPSEDVLSVLPPDLQTKFRSKAREYGTPASDRIFCATPTCSEFLGSSKHLDRNAPCRKCSTSTCTLCKQRSHPHENCNHAALTSLRALARERQWQTCPGCGSIIELRDGCNHVTCRCHMEFCYVCAAPWKTCACPQWNREDEADVGDEEEIEEWREAVIPPRRIDDVWGPRAHAPVIPDVWGPRAEAPVIPPMWIDEGVRVPRAAPIIGPIIGPPIWTAPIPPNPVAWIGSQARELPGPYQTCPPHQWQYRYQQPQWGGCQLCGYHRPLFYRVSPHNVQ
ncbi:hypothetical protein FB446DRAFT_729918 [Lentinula raphanica]|nr:hypothetical protein FB446DRAFT_729918 [Lentinula raphanica]